ncbi:MAG: endopeptidase La [Firmicutes bacterium]|nr:endopeptidase La [Bacillota bacterium]
MIKTSLPVILLRGLILLPEAEVRLEFEQDKAKNIIDVSELFHDNQVLVVSGYNQLEETPHLSDLPKFGVVATITNKVELPNGKIRIMIRGVKRARVYDYLNLNLTNEALEAIIETSIDPSVPEEESSILINKLNRELTHYLELIPYVSNSAIEKIRKEKDLSVVTDLIASHLPLSFERFMEYLKEWNPKLRTEMILEDLYAGEQAFELERELDTKVKQELDHSQKDYILREKIKILKEELGEDTSLEEENSDIKERIESLTAPEQIKDKLRTEMRRYEQLPPMSPELGVIKTYIQWFLDLPWNVYTKDEEDLQLVKKRLDASHAGLRQVKTRIIEYLAVTQMTKSLTGPIICLVGPPGVGKTTLAISIAKAIHKNFVKISVGGVSDEAEIIGHRRTYVGASPGRIISSMKKAKSSNPVFLIDEIDKLNSNYRGDPASSLLEVLDPEQNKTFVDNYLEEAYDLSQVMFILTANYIDEIPEALKDRLEIVELSGYTEYEKVDIAKKHLLKNICKNHGISRNKIKISDTILLKIIRGYTKEAGVRELERKLSTIIRKIVTEMVTTKTVNDTYIIDSHMLYQYLGREKYSFSKVEKKQVGVVNGLAYTNYGGDTLPIEVTYFKGNGNLVLTGSLGDVMKESAHIAFSYIKANASYFQIPYELLTEYDIHIHVPEGAIKKDGPSAGITLTTALVSALTNQEVSENIAMTGEITLRGEVLPIGGLKEKAVGASRTGITKIIIPKDNMGDIESIPLEVRKQIQFYPVKDYKEVYELVKRENNTQISLELEI